MSATIPNPLFNPPPVTAQQAVEKSSTVTGLVANLQTAAALGAQDVPASVKAISQLDPDLAPKALIAAKSPWGTVLGLIVGIAAARLGLMCSATAAATAGCWTQSTIDMVSGLGAIVGTAIGAYVMRWFTTARVGGVLSSGATTPPVGKG